ncbi:MAG: hypothetical protein C4317_04295 [Acidimicrobiia bacterium]
MSSERASPIESLASSRGAQISQVGGVRTAYSYGNLACEISAVLKEAGLFDLWVRPVLSVIGEDSASFLQGQLSQDVQSMSEDTWRLSFRLFPNGKIESFLRVIRGLGDDGSMFLLDTDPGFGGALRDSLCRYLIRVRVRLEEPKSIGFLRVAGPEASRLLQSVGIAVPSRTDEVLSQQVAGIGASLKVLEALYPGAGLTSLQEGIRAYDILVGEDEAGRVWKALSEKGATPCGWIALEAFRIAAAFPSLGTELDEKTIVQETGLEKIAVAFQKGCYLGQELVARIDSRGHVNRYLRRLRAKEQSSSPSRDVLSSTPPPGSRILFEGRQVGTVTSSVAAPFIGTVALAYVRREVSEGNSVIVDWKDGQIEALVESRPELT